MGPDRWKVQEIRDEESFRDLRPEWNELLGRSRSDTLFLTWEWLHCWWSHLGGGRRLAILTVRDGEALAGVAPLMRGRGPLPSLKLLGTGAVGSDYLDVIAERGREDAVLDALANRLRSRGRTLLLHGVAPGASAADLAARLDEMGWSHATIDANTCPYIDLAGGGWEAYLAGLSASHRYNFRRRWRHLVRDHDVELQQPASAHECAAALEVLIELHRRRWDARGGSDALHRPELVAFHRELAPLALANGWLRLFVLRLDGRPAAALYGFNYRGRYLFYQSGFDPAFRGHSPSLVLLGLTIRRAFEEGAHEYDLLHGAERYKQHWASRRRLLQRIECHPPGPAAAFLRTQRRLATAARRLARQTLPEPVVAALAGLKERAS